MRDYLHHILVDTPLDPPLRRLRFFSRAVRGWWRPELAGVLREPQEIERLLQTAIHDGMNCIDIGAHLGSYLSRYRKLSPTGQHIGVEPIPYKVEWLRKKFPRCIILDCALGEETGEADLHVRDVKTGKSSLRAGADHTFEAVTESRIRVPVRRLDDLVDPTLPIHFVEINVVGAELMALRGGVGLLKRWKPSVLFGAAEDSLQAFGAQPTDLYRFFDELGYELHRIDRWLRKEPKLTIEDFAACTVYPFKAFNFYAVPSETPAPGESDRP